MDEGSKLVSEIQTDPESAKARWRKLVYVEEVPSNIDRFRELLENYSKVPADEVDALLVRTRDKLWNVYQYPCIGRWGFVKLRSIVGPRLDAATKRLLAQDSHDALLDIGCCIGQVLRLLAYRGVDPSRLYGTDLHPEFITIGNELFGDEGRGPTFVAGDMLDPQSESLKPLDGKVTMISAANFFHLFKWDDQVKIGTRLMRFLQPGATDAVIFGRQIGTHNPRQIGSIKTFYVHNQESFQKLWDEIGEKTGTKWRVEVEVIEELTVDLPIFGKDERYIRFGIYKTPLPGQ